METRRDQDRHPRPPSAISNDDPNAALYDLKLPDTGYVTMKGNRPKAPTPTQ